MERGKLGGWWLVELPDGVTDADFRDVELCHMANLVKAAIRYGCQVCYSKSGELCIIPPFPMQQLTISIIAEELSPEEGENECH